MNFFNILVWISNLKSKHFEIILEACEQTQPECAVSDEEFRLFLEWIIKRCCIGTFLLGAVTFCVDEQNLVVVVVVV